MLFIRGIPHDPILLNKMEVLSLVKTTPTLVSQSRPGYSDLWTGRARCILEDQSTQQSKTQQAFSWTMSISVEDNISVLPWSRLVFFLVGFGPSSKLMFWTDLKLLWLTY